MPKPIHDIHLDFETYCDLDLKKVGVYRYVEHPSFRVMSAAWKVDDRATLWCIIPERAPHWLPPSLIACLQSPTYQGHAWNAAFETAVLAQLKIFAANPLSCTMQRALAYGLPGRLDQAGAALGLAHQKDMAGHRLMLKMSRPPKPGAGPHNWSILEHQALAEYCGKDVDAEAAISEVIPELQPDEAELSALDAAMNTEGALGTDLHRVLNFKIVAEEAEKTDATRCEVLTAGAVTSPGTQTARLLAWLASKSVILPDTTRATIEEALLVSPTVFPEVEEVLQIRLRMARASTRKLQRMLDMTGLGTSLRGQFQFCGAGRTGRWSGRGVQVQNLPRIPKGFSPDLFAEMARVATLDGGLDAIAPAPVLDCVSWSLRSCLKATNNTSLLWSFDFSQIEARVLAWLAGQRDVLGVFASGEDVYVWAAAQFGSKDRQLGKVLVLALGFGMGATKLQETALKSYGVKLTPGQAERFKDGWRRSNYHIVQFWYTMQASAAQAILNRNTTVPVAGSGVAFCCTSKTLQMRLPSGRVLYYHKPRLERDSGSIIYWGAEVGGRWVEQRSWGGKLAENATQAAARDIMSEAMLRAFRRQGLIPCMTVHDELVYAMGMGQTLLGMMDLMLEPPPWAGGLPLAGESKLMHRYGVPLSFGTVAKAP